MISYIHSFRFQLYLYWQYYTARLLLLLTLVYLLFPIRFVDFSADRGIQSEVIIGGDAVPALMIYMLLNSLSLLFMVLYLMVILGINDILFNGQALQTILARNRNRLIHYSSVLIFLLFFTAIVVFGQSLFLIMLAKSYSLAFHVFLSSLLVYLMILLQFATLVNFNATRKLAILFLIILFLVLPVVLNSIPLFKGDSFIINSLIYLIDGLKFLLSPSLAFSELSSEIVMKEYVRYDIYWKNLPLMAGYLLFNLYWFKRKDIH